MRVAAPGTSWISWWGAGMVLAVCLLASLPQGVRAQEDAGRESDRYRNSVGPPLPEHHCRRIYARQGFRPRQDQAACLNISFYGLFRYMNQLPGDQTFIDHLGREQPVKTRNDLNWHRTFVWLTGFFYTQKFRYNITSGRCQPPSRHCSSVTFSTVSVRHSCSASASRPISRPVRCRVPGRSGAAATGRWRRTSSAAGSRRVSSSPASRVDRFFYTAVGQQQHQPARHHRGQ